MQISLLIAFRAAAHVVGFVDQLYHACASTWQLARALALARSLRSFSLYLRFYLIQFAVTYLIQSISFFLSESHLHWTHLLRNIRKRREKEAELAKIAEEAAKEMFGDESEEESGEESEEEEKPLRKIDSAVDVAALGQFKSMTGLRSTHRGRERFVRPVSPAPDTSVKPLSSTEHGKPEQDSLQVPQPRHASRSLSASKKRKMSIAPPPTTPLNLETLKSFIVRLVFDKFPNQLIRYLEAVFRSTAFLWTNEMVIRAGYCLLAEFDRRRRGVKVADISRYWPIIYLINVIGSIPMVVERHSRVTIINRMMWVAPFRCFISLLTRSMQDHLPRR